MIYQFAGMPSMVGMNYMFHRNAWLQSVLKCAGKQKTYSIN